MAYKLRDKTTGLYLNKRNGWNELNKNGKLYLRKPSVKKPPTIWGRNVDWEIVEFDLVEHKPRPYEPLQMTTQMWKDIKPEKVDLTTVVFSQERIDIQSLLHPSKSYSGDDIPHLVEYEGKLWVSDGHHRIVRLLLSGWTHSFCRVKRIGNP